MNLAKMTVQAPFPARFVWTIRASEWEVFEMYPANMKERVGFAHISLTTNLASELPRMIAKRVVIVGLRYRVRVANIVPLTRDPGGVRRRPISCESEPQFLRVLFSTQVAQLWVRQGHLGRGKYR